MTDVFISHTQHDNAFAEKLASALDERGLKVWHSDKHSRLGDHWVHIIEHAIKDAKNILVILSDNSAKSDWIRVELAIALSQRGKRVVPIFTSKNSDVPFLLRDIKGVDLSNPDTFSASVDNLIPILNMKVSQIESNIENENLSRVIRAKIESTLLDHERVIVEQNKKQKNLLLSMILALVSTITVLMITSLFISINVIESTTTILWLFIGIGLGIASSFLCLWLTYLRRKLESKK